MDRLSSFWWGSDINPQIDDLWIYSLLIDDFMEIKKAELWEKLGFVKVFIPFEKYHPLPQR